MLVEVSNAELIDKCTILRIKRERATRPVDVAHIDNEMAALRPAFEDLGQRHSNITTLVDQLARVNCDLWRLEDAVRCPGIDHIAMARLARQIFHLNDDRAALKRCINEQTGSAFHEVKIRALHPSPLASLGL